MKNEVIKVRVDRETKMKFKKRSEERGLTMSEEMMNLINASLTDDVNHSKSEDSLRNMELQLCLSSLYNILSEVKCDRKNELVKGLGELECLL